MKFGLEGGFPEDVEKSLCGWLSQTIIDPGDVRRIVSNPPDREEADGAIFQKTNVD